MTLSSRVLAKTHDMTLPAARADGMFNLTFRLPTIIMGSPSIQQISQLHKEAGIGSAQS